MFENEKVDYLRGVKRLLLETEFDIFGKVYFVQIVNKDAYIKVGFTKDVEQRWKSVTDNPYELAVISTFRASMKHERKLHEILTKHNVRGEWFYPDPEVIAVAEHLNGVDLVKDATEFEEKRRQHVVKIKPSDIGVLKDILQRDGRW